MSWVASAAPLATSLLGFLGKKDENKQAREQNALQREDFEFRKELSTAPVTDALGNKFSYDQGKGFQETLAPNQQTLLKSQEAEDLSTGPGNLNARQLLDTQSLRRSGESGQLAQALLSRVGRVPQLAGGDLYNIAKGENATRNTAAYDQLQRALAMQGARTGSPPVDDLKARAESLAQGQPSYIDAITQALQLRDAQDAGPINDVAALEALSRGEYVPFQYQKPDVAGVGNAQRYLGAQVVAPRAQAVESGFTNAANGINAGSEAFKALQAALSKTSSPTRQLSNSSTSPSHRDEITF